ncbi:RNA methyltransferase tRNA(m5U54)methyltransferase [Orbilia blumenaviensis]|uniref:tRNA (guanine(26)-N(2))-dimethyltransferase n=1 Tax=Orbilia blumenaviensis TaxID=1796055 RepID=A0AAV9VA81_9PEZI
MARRKARAARAAAAAPSATAATLHTDSSNGGADVSLPDAPTTETASNQTPAPGQAQAKHEAQAAAKATSSKKQNPTTPPLETVTINGITYQVQPEGQAKILLPPVEGGNTTEVFYNYIQKFNRDLTMTVTRGFGDILESERKMPRRKHRGGVKHNHNGKRQKVDGGECAVLTAAKDVEDAGKEGAEAITQSNEANDIQQQHDANQQLASEAADKEDIEMAESEPLPPQEAANDGEAQTATTKPRFAVLDALSATGLRALRYAKELPFVTHVTANDMSSTAVEYIYRNVQFNGLTDIITPNHDNATGHMYRTAFPNYIPVPTPENPFKMKLVPSQKYHVIDLDPYGSATQFIDSAVQALEDGGLLSVTCTDAAIFASTSYPEKTFATYGGLPAKGDFSHETGLRMVLMSIATTAAKYGLYIEPLLSLSIDYYCRVFVRVRKSPENVKKLSSKGMVVVTCDAGCGAWKVQELGTLRVRQQDKKRKKQQKANDTTAAVGKGGEIPSYKYGIAQAVESGRCDHCGFKMHVAGPMWSDEIHSAGFINHLLSNVVGNETVKGYETLGRINGMLRLALGELMPPTPAPKDIPAPPLPPAAATATTETPPNGQGDESVDRRPSLKRKLKQREEAAEKEGEGEEDDAEEGGTRKGLVRPTRNPTADPLALFIMPTQLARVLHCTAPSVSAFRGALMGLGYHVTKSHCRAGSLKTDAPWSQIWRVMRAWERENPVKEGSVTPGMAGYKILYPAAGGVREEGEEFEDVVFDEVLGKDKEKGKGEVLYQQNPGAYWGPMAKASKKGLTAEESSKLGNAEKDKRRREEREKRREEREREGLEERERGKRKRRAKGEEVEEVAGPVKGVGGSRESDGAQYGLAAISASEMEKLEREAMKS